MEAIDTMTAAAPAELDVDGFRSMVEEHGTRMFRLAYRITGNASDAEDVVQEAFLRAYRNLHRYDPRCKASSWLLTIVSNASIDHLRRRKRRRAGDEDPLDDQAPLASDGPDPERRALGGEIHARIVQELETLTVKERTAFVLRHFEGLSIEEIGKITGAGRNTTKNQIFRAVRKLRRALRPVVEATP